MRLVRLCVCAVLVSLVLKVSPLIVNIYPSIASSITTLLPPTHRIDIFLYFLVSCMYLRPRVAKWSVIARVDLYLFIFE